MSSEKELNKARTIALQRSKHIEAKNKFIQKQEKKPVYKQEPSEPSFRINNVILRKPEPKNLFNQMFPNK